MPSFTLYDLNPEFWAQVQAKAAREGVTVKALILKLLTAWLAAVCVLSLGACAYHAPDAPTPVPPMANDVPYALTLTAITGVGAQGGHSTITALVSNLHGAALPHVMVSFAADGGTLAPSSLETGADGTAATTITGVGTATVTAHAGAITTTTRVSNQTLPVPPPAPPEPGPTPSPAPGPTPNPGPTPTPPAGPLSVTITVQAGPLSVTTIATIINGPATILAWTWGDGTAFTGSSATSGHSYTAAGDYVIKLTVTDAIGRTASASTPTTVLPMPIPLPAPTPPPPAPSYTVSLVATPSTVVVGDPSTLTATVTRVNGAVAPTSFKWDCLGDGTAIVTTGTNTTSCTYSTASTVTSTVVVTGGLASGTGSTPITVTAQAPLFVNITVSPNSTPAVDGWVTFTATVTSTRALPATFQWEWDNDGDGTTDVVTPGPNGNTQTTSYGSVGVKTIKVRVTDPASGRTATGTRTITVS